MEALNPGTHGLHQCGAHLAIIPSDNGPEIALPDGRPPRTASLARALQKQTSKILKSSLPGALRAHVMTTPGKLTGCTPSWAIFHDHDGPWDVHHSDPNKAYIVPPHYVHRHKPADPFPDALNTCTRCDNISPLTPQHILTCPALNPHLDETLREIASLITTIERGLQPNPAIISPAAALALELEAHLPEGPALGSAPPPFPQGVHPVCLSCRACYALPTAGW